MEQSKSNMAKGKKLQIQLLSCQNNMFLQKIERRLKSSDSIKSPLIKHTITTTKISKMELKSKE